MSAISSIQGDKVVWKTLISNTKLEQVTECADESKPKTRSQTRARKAKTDVIQRSKPNTPSVILSISTEATPEVATEATTEPTKKKRTPAPPLQRYFIDTAEYEAGVDEAGRGPLFGRVYAAAVILPRDDIEGFRPELIKDSKKYTSKKKIQEVYEMIKKYAVSYCVAYAEAKEIDKINIRRATLKTMNQALDGLSTVPQHLLVDGCDFPCYRRDGRCIPHICIEGGDNQYTCIAAASILAKVERDAYIEALVKDHPELDTRYNIGKNMGYGTAAHIQGIKQHGISRWHRRSFGICKGYSCASGAGGDDDSENEDEIVATIWEDGEDGEDDGAASATATVTVPTPAIATAIATATVPAPTGVDLFDFSVLYE